MEVEEKFTPVYEVSIYSNGNIIHEFHFEDLDNSKKVYNRIRDVVLRHSRLIVIDTLNESESLMGTANVVLTINKVEYEEIYAKELIENTKADSIKFIGN